MRDVDGLNYVVGSNEDFRLLPMRHPKQHSGGPFIELDFESFTPHVQKLNRKLEGFNPAVAEIALRGAHIGTSATLFKTTQSVLEVIKEIYPSALTPGSVDIFGRNFAYSVTTELLPIRLSEAFDRNIAMCAEIAALSQFLLKNRGIESDLVCGAFGERFGKDAPIEGARHFFLIVHGQGDYPVLFDPSNSRAPAGYSKMLPFLSTVTKDDLAKMDNFQSLGVLPDTLIMGNRQMAPERFYGFAKKAMGDDVLGDPVIAANPAHIQPELKPQADFAFVHII